MESSLIPRPFSPTDAKRRAEENAREAERRTSARNASSSAIGPGGKLALTGDVNVGGGGSINLASGGGVNVATGGAIKVAGTFKYAPASIPVDGTAIVGTDTDATTGALTPGLFYTDPATAKYGVRFKAGELVLESNTSAPAVYPVSTDVGKIYPDAVGKFSCYANYLKMFTGFGSSSSQFTVTPEWIKMDIGSHNLVLNSSGVLVDGAAIGGTPKLKHWERSGTTSAPDSTVWGPGIITADPAVSTDTGLLTMISQDVAQIRDAGTYAISVGMRFPSGVTATNSRSAISVEPISGPMFCKGPVIQTDDQGAGSIPNIRLTAGQQFHIYIVQISGATRVMSFTVRVTKISD